MTIADASETELAFIAESTFGVTPATPAFQKVRLTSEDLTGEINTVVSNELRPDAEVADLIKVGESGTGNLPFELSFGSEFDTLFEHALRGSFASNAAIDTGVTALSVGATNTFNRAAGDFLAQGFEVGMRVTSSGFTDAANNGTFLVVGVSALVLTVAESTLVVEAAGVDEQIVAQGSQLAAATEKKSITLEKRHDTGATDQYFRYRGSRIGSMALTFRQQEVVTGSFGIQGLDETIDTAIIAGANYTNPNDKAVMSAIDVGTIHVDGVATPMFYTEISLNLNNNLRAQNALGAVGAIGIGYGRREITGNLTAYFETADLYEEAVNNNAIALAWPVSDGANSYTFSLPKVKFTSRRAVAGGNNQDIFAELQYQALVDTIQGTSIKIQNA